MNWNDETEAARVQLALIKLPARVPVTDERYGGVLLTNPGGPGDSGVYQVLAGGPHIQTIISPAEGEDGKFFDIIGFDPRAVNNTTPHLTCFPDGPAETRWLTNKPSDRLLDINERALNENWARTQALGMSCAADRGNSTNVVRYANTAQVVEDVVAIIEKHGEWREAEAQRLLSQSKRKDTSETTAVLERTRWKKGVEPLNFWGISYGTVLGQTFAAMHPDRVHRLILDGVVDADDYHRAKWLTGLHDTDQIIAKWGEYCFEAKEACPLYEPDHKLPALFFAKLASGIAKFLDNPIPLDTKRGPAFIEYDDVMDLLGMALYGPYRYAETFARLFAELSKGNGSSLSAWKAKNTQPVTLTETCEREGPFSESCLQSTRWIHAAVVCADADDITDHTKDDFKAYLAKMQRESDAMGSAWSRLMMPCINWPARPAWRFEGPFTATTAHPILFIGNTHDTVSPLRSAQHASEQFPGSAVLQSNIEGHASYANPSICTAKAMRAYFQDGILPKPGTICEPEFRPWLGCVNPNGCHNRSSQDETLFQTLHDLTTVWPGIELPGVDSSR